MAADTTQVEQEQPPAGFSKPTAQAQPDQEQPPAGFQAAPKPDVSGIPNVYAPMEVQNHPDDPPIPGMEHLDRSIGQGGKSNLHQIPWTSIGQLGLHPDQASQFESMYGPGTAQRFLPHLAGSAVDTSGSSDLVNEAMPGLKPALETMGAGFGGMAGFGGGPASFVTVPAGGALGAAAGAGIYDALSNLVHAWRGDTDKSGKPITMSQETIDMLRSGVAAFGGTVGTAVDLPFKSAVAQLAGKIATGAAGTAVGTFTGNQAAVVAKTWGLLPKEERTPTMLENLQNSATSGVLDLLWGSAMAGGPLAAKAVVGKFLGLDTPEARKLYEASQELKIPLSVSNLTTKGIVLGFQRIANIFPLLAHPLDHLITEQKAAVDNFIDRQFSDAKVNGKWVGLGKPPLEPDLSWASLDAAKNLWNSVDGYWRNQYNMLLSKAAGKGQFIPTNKLVGLGNQLLLNLKARNVDTGDASALGFSQKEVKLAQDISSLGPKISLSEADGILQRAEALFNEGGPQGRKVEGLQDLASTVHQALRSSSLGKQFTAIDTGWNNALQPFRTAVGKQFTTADKNAFVASLSSIPGTKPEAELGKMIYSMSSPDQVLAARELVGPDLMRKASSYVLQQAVIDGRSIAPGSLLQKFFAATKIFDQDKFAAALGLDNPNSNRWQGVSVALNGSGVKPKDLENFVNVMKVVNKNKVAGTATMLARSAVLTGGLGSAARYIFPLLEVDAHGTLPVIASTYMGMAIAYKGVQMAASPHYLNTIMHAVDDTLANYPRRMAWLRLINMSMPGVMSPNKESSDKAKAAATDTIKGTYQSIAP